MHRPTHHLEHHLALVFDMKNQVTAREMRRRVDRVRNQFFFGFVAERRRRCFVSSDYCPLAAAVPVPAPPPAAAAAEDASHTSIYQKYQKYQKLLKLKLISKFTINNNKPPQSHYYQYEVLPNHCHRRCVCSCFQYDPQRGCPNLQEIVSSYLFASVWLGWENVLE